MKINRNTLMRTFSVILLLAICSLLLPPAPVLADDNELPDFSTLDGKIPGIDIPIVEGPFIEKNRSFHVTYRDGKDSSLRELLFFISYYQDPSEISQLGQFKTLQTDWAKNPAGTGPLYLEKWPAEPGYHDIRVENPHPLRFYLIVYRPPYGWAGYLHSSYRENYLINITGAGNGWASDAQFLDYIDKLRKYATDAIDDFIAGIRGSLILEHCSPFSDWQPGGLISKGDFVATLKDKNGKGVSGKTVYFFQEAAVYIERVLKFPEGEGVSFHPQSTYEFDILGFKSIDYAMATTDRNGRARWNYLENRAADYDFLITESQRASEKEGVIYAVVFDKDPTLPYDTGKLAKIEYSAEVKVDFKGVAAITSRGMVDSSKESVIKVGPPGQQQVVGNNLGLLCLSIQRVFPVRKAMIG